MVRARCPNTDDVYEPWRWHLWCGGLNVNVLERDDLVDHDLHQAGVDLVRQDGDMEFVDGVPGRQRKPTAAVGEDWTELAEEKIVVPWTVNVTHDDDVVPQVGGGDRERVYGFVGGEECGP